MRKLFLILALLCASRASASIANIYYAQNAAGLGDGSSCANAYAYTDATNGLAVTGKWGAGATQIGAGTTIHLCGTITVAAGGSVFTFLAGGTAGSPITVLFESGAVLQSPAFSQTLGAIKTGSNAWIVVDGGTNGVIQNTANGSGLAFHQPSTGVSAGGSNLTIQNLTIANICVHTVNDANGCISGGAGDQGISVFGSNITVTKNTIHDTQIGINACCGAGSNFTFSFNTISRVNWGIGLGTFNASFTGLTINGNDIFCVLGAACNWDSSDNVNFHHNGVMIDPQGSGGVDTTTISNNRIRDFGTFQTAHIFIDPNTASVTNLKIYNNVLAVTSGASGPGVAFVTLQEAATSTHPGPVTSALVANNTISGGGGGCIVGQVTPTWENNICSGPFNPLKLYTGFTSPVSDYNDFFNFGGSFTAGSTNYATLAAWQTGTGLDTHSVTTNPNLNADYTLPSPLPGVNLTSLGIAGLDVGAPQFFGVNYACGTGCVARQTTGAWDMGAYPTSSGVAPPAVAITAPTANSTVSGSSVTLTMTCAPNGGHTISSVQFQVDGVNYGVAGNASPYTLAGGFDSTKASNSSHTITATCVDSASLQNLVSETVTVSNSIPGCFVTDVPFIGNINFPAISGSSATVTWTGQPFMASTEDTVMGLSNVIAGAYSDLATSVRFSNNGQIQVFDGAISNYRADNVVTYVAGTTYSFSAVLNFTNHTYSITETAPSSVVLCASCAFRTTQNTLTQVQYMNGESSAPTPVTAKVCSVATSPVIAITPSPANFGNVTQGVTSAPVTVTVSNTGGATLTLATPFLGPNTGANPADFTNAGGGTCSNGLAILAGSSCTILEAFTPSTTSAESATLNVNGTVNGSITMNGTGVPVPTQPAPTLGGIIMGFNTIDLTVGNCPKTCKIHLACTNCTQPHYTGTIQ